MVVPEMEEQFLDTIFDPLRIFTQHHPVSIEHVRMEIIELLQALHITGFEFFPIIVFCHAGGYITVL
jgi:hypothetical protein